MVKSIFGGITVCAAVLLSTGVAHATNPPVTEVCPEATWADGYRLWELMALPEDQYKRAEVIGDPSNVRRGAGFESEVAFTLGAGSQVTITGETWDGGCNQWMQVQIGVGDEIYWMHGNLLQNL